MSSPPWLTLFTAPKPFDRPHIALIQRNAIRSWLALGPEVAVLLLGDEPGIAEAAQEMGVRHIPQVACNDRGTPLIPSLFAVAHEASPTPYLCYLNGDIVLLPDFLPALKAVAAQVDGCFLAVGQRWDLDVREPLDFGPGWDARLRERVAREGRLHSRHGIDFFAFPQGCFRDIPPLVVGRSGWDNWMIYHARSQGWPVVDLTPSVLVVHQNHDYAHLPGGQPHYRQEESERNVALAGGPARMYTLWEASHELRHGRVRRKPWHVAAWIHRQELRLLRDGFPHHGWRRLLIRRLRRLRFGLERWEAAHRRPPPPFGER